MRAINISFCFTDDLLPNAASCAALVSTTKSAARVPRGFDADHPDLDWIKLKSFSMARGGIEPPTQGGLILPLNYFQLRFNFLWDVAQSRKYRLIRL